MMPPSRRFSPVRLVCTESRFRRAAICLALSLLCVVSRVYAEPVESFTEPVKTIDVAAGEMGVVTVVNVKDGQHVVVGDLLAELDSEVLVSTLEMARARAEATGAIEAARAERDLKLKRLTQLEKLMTRGHATTGELARARTDLAVAEARVQMADEEIRMAGLECSRIRAQIERRKFRSPISGLVSQVHRDVGESCMAQDPRIVTLVDLSQLRVRFQVLPRQSLQFDAGQVVTVTLPDVELQVKAKVERISPVMDSRSGTVEVAVLIENQKQNLRSGTRCVIELSDASGSPLIRPLPTRSVTRER